MLRLLWRAHRTGLIVATIFSVFYMLVNTASYPQVAGTTPEARRAFAASMQAVALQITWLFPLPSHLDTITGYVQWRGYPFLGLVLLVWAIIAGTGLVRGEEERGLTDMYLAAGTGRVRWLLWRIGGFACAVAIMTVVTSVATWLGIVAAGFTVSGTAILLQAVATWGLGLALFGIVLVVCELVAPRGVAVGVSTLVLVILYFLDSLSRTNHALTGVAQISPFHLFNATRALVPGGSLAGGPTLALYLIGVVAFVLSVVVFATRDLNSGVLRLRGVGKARATVVAARNPLLRVPVLGELWEQRWSLAVWAVSVFLLAIITVTTTNSAAGLLKSNPALSVWLTPGISPFRSVLSAAWFTLMGLGVAIFAIVQTSRWAGQDQSGRLEMVLSGPTARWRVILERAVALGVATLVLGVVGSLGVVAGAAQSHQSLGDRLWVATLLLVPVGMSFGAIGAALAAWRPRLATGLLAALAVVSYFLQVFTPLFKAPHWVVNLSIFQLYGTPFISEVFVNGLLAMTAIVVVGFGIAMLAMQRREVGR